MSVNATPTNSLLPMRGLMLDAARLVESFDYYCTFLDFCAAWDINAVIFRLTDDQGCAMRFQSHPELLTHANALTPSEVARLANYAAERGIELILEIESLGHSRYITSTSEFADINDQGTEGPDWANSLIPMHPKTLQLLDDLYCETAALFPSRYLHAGCDETNWGGSDFSRQLLATHSKAQVWGDYLNTLLGKIQRLGREMIIWDDMVLQHDPSILDYLDNRIILHDWEYAGTDPAQVTARLTLAREKGFRMLGGPAVCWCKWGPRVGREQLGNIDAYVDVYRNTPTPAALGVIVTNWVPSRYLRDAIWDGMAYAAMAVNEGSTQARANAFQRFVETYYGATWDDDWAEFFTTVYDATPTRQGEQPVQLLVPWADEAELQQAINAAPLPTQPFAALLEKMAALEPQVQHHQTDFTAFRLSIAYLAHLYWRQAAVNGLTEQQLPPVLREVAQRDAEMATALLADWQRGRTGDPLAELALSTERGFGPADWLHGRFLAAAKFSREKSQSMGG